MNRRINKNKRGSKRRMVTSAIPHERIVCGIDPGETSGYAIYICGAYRMSGIAIAAIDKQYIVNNAYELSKIYDVNLYYFAENWPSAFLPDRKRMGHQSILGMGASWGLWLQEIQKIRGRVVRIDTPVWRRFYDLHRCNREQAKKMALTIASRLANKTIKDHNEAEAILIAHIGCYLEVL